MTEKHSLKLKFDLEMYQGMFLMLSEREDKKRFVAAFIHAMLDGSEVRENKQQAGHIKLIYTSKNDIQNHDEIIAVKDLYDPDAEEERLKEKINEVPYLYMLGMTKTEDEINRFKKAFIHVMLCYSDVDERNQHKLLLQLYKSEDQIPSHDDIITVQQLCIHETGGIGQGFGSIQADRDADEKTCFIQSGKAIFLCCDEFEKDGKIDENKSRSGRAIRDKEAMKELLGGFNIVPINDDCDKLTMEKYKSTILQAKENFNQAPPDVFVCVVSSHGREDKGGGKIQHYISLQDGEIPTNELIAEFNDLNCEPLKGKPRLFFIQCCRVGEDNEKFDRGLGVEKDLTVTDSKDRKDVTEVDAVPYGSDTSLPFPRNLSAEKRRGVEESRIYLSESVQDMINHEGQANFTTECTKVPDICYTDCLVMFSSPPGKVAYGQKHGTSWLIMTLEEAFEESKDEENVNLLEILTSANSKMSEMITSTIKDGKETITNAKYKCIPVIYHKLTKDLYLTKDQRKNII